jgi:hypothetical protein
MICKHFIYKEWCDESKNWVMRVYYPYGKPKLTRQYAQISQESIDNLKTKKEVLSIIFKPKL